MKRSPSLHNEDAPMVYLPVLLLSRKNQSLPSKQISSTSLKSTALKFPVLLAKETSFNVQEPLNKFLFALASFEIEQDEKVNANTLNNRMNFFIYTLDL